MAQIKQSVQDSDPGLQVKVFETQSVVPFFALQRGQNLFFVTEAGPMTTAVQ